MNKLLTLLIFAMFAFSVFVSAQSEGVEIEINEIKGVITANDVAEYDLVISNNMGKDMDFFVAKSFYSEKWRVVADPYFVSTASGFSRSTKLHISPTGFLIPADYKFVITVESRDKSYSKEIPVDVKVVPFGDENVKTELIVEDKIDPRLGSVARVSLDNLYNFDIDNVKLEFNSELFSFDRDFKLKANEKRVEIFQLSFNEDAKLGEYKFNAVVKTGDGNYILGRAVEEVILSPYSEVTGKVFISNKFNKKILITKENTGTEERKEQVKIELSVIENLLSRFNVQPDSIDKVDGKYLAEWKFLLEPGDRKDIVVTIPYGTYLLILLVISLLTYITYYVTKRKVVLVKKVINVTKDREGIRGIKIILHLKNKGNKAIEKIRVIDYLPSLVAASSQDFGSMKPTRTQKSLDGRMRLVWDFDGLGRKEERILSYIAKSNLSIIGKLLLPEAVVEYQTGKKLYHVRSNKLTLLTKASAKEKKS